MTCTLDRRRFVLLLAGLLPGWAVSTPTRAAAENTGQSRPGAYAFRFDGIDGKPLALGAFRGRVMLVVNTASQCGFTRQYGPLQALYQRYRGRGLVVIGVPSNDFGGQEPGGNAEIQGFCSSVHGVAFPMAGKSVVRGPQAHPFYRWAAATLGAGNAPRWNFHKYLIGRDGQLAGAFASHVEPDDPALVAAIEAALAAPAG